MFPHLISRLPLVNYPLHSYGLMIALGFAAGIYLSLREGRRVGISRDDLLDLSFWILVSSMIGSRLLFIIVNWRDYVKNPLALISLSGGLVFYGGLLGAVLASYWFMRRYKLPFLKVSDTMIPGVALGHFFGRLGCLGAGCCWGRECPADFPLAAIFTHPASQPVANHLANVPLYPVQLFEAAGELLICLILLLARTRKRFHGQVLLSYVILYAALRSVDETFRGDGLRGFVIEDLLSTSQLLSILLALAALAASIVLVRRRSSLASPARGAA